MRMFGWRLARARGGLTCKPIMRVLLWCCVALSVGAASADPLVGAAAPGFTVKDVRGHAHRLSDYTGKIVVLEWSSPECLYSRRYYDNGTLNALYGFAATNGIVWINVVPKLQEMTAEQALARLTTEKKIAVFDDDYAVSAAYDATTTPQIHIIDKRGVLAYSGAIDSTATLKKTAGPIVPYVKNALDDLLAGREVGRKITQAFGCYIQRRH